MNRKILQLGFCLLVLAALATFNAPAVQAIPFSYSQSGVSGTMAQACSNAVQKIKNNCDFYGPITTTQGSCKPLWGIDGQVIGTVCTCTATTTACGNINPL
jgi:hypothetical protein